MLIPLLKGLKIGKITSELAESQDITVDQPYPSKQCHMSRVVAQDEWQLPVDAETEDIEGQEGYKFTRLLQIPRSLRDCVQTLDVTGIRIKHRLQFVVQLLNPDGHVSEVSHWIKTVFSDTEHYDCSFEQLFLYTFSYPQTCQWTRTMI